MDSKQQIIQALLELCQEEGLADASTGKIARKAHIAKGTLFHHFPNKEALIRTAYLEINTQLAQAIQPYTSLNETKMALREQLKFIWVSGIEFWIQYPKAFEFARQVFTSRYFTLELKKMAEQIFQPFHELLKKGIAQGELRPMNTTLIISIIYNIGNTTTRLALEHPHEMRLALVDESFAFIWQAIKKH